MTASSVTNPYLRKVACKTCPFRRENVGMVRPDRAAEIALGLLQGGGFTCHKTTVPDETDENMIPGPRAQECAGALATMERAGHSGQLARIAERLGLYDPDRLQVERSGVFDSLAEWVAAHREKTEQALVHCDVAGPHCEDPPGYDFGGNVSGSLDEAQCDPDNSCSLCGHVMCESCQDQQDHNGEIWCVYCTEDDQE